MLNYRCDYCDTYFDTPTVLRHKEHLGEFAREYTTEHCPICGGDSFSDATICPKCGEPMPAHSPLCPTCRSDLLRRFTAFADTLTAEEEEQLDDWLDGDSITNRRKWT